jgi:putative membrane protein
VTPDAVASVRRPAVRLVPSLVGATVLLQICYPLSSGEVRNALTVAVVTVAAVASAVHAARSRGRGAGAVLLATAAFGFLVEVVGVHSGVPFGAYRYAGSLGPRLWSVPVVIALAWTMLAWPAALVAARLARSLPARVVIGGWALAAWDVYLDPQMVAAGHWRWSSPHLVLPGVSNVPVTNFLGWLAVGLVISWALQSFAVGPAVAPPRRDDAWMVGFWIWTWLSSAFALGVFLHLGAAAGWGLLAMGVVGVPLLLRELRREVRR